MTGQVNKANARRAMKTRARRKSASFVARKRPKRNGRRRATEFAPSR